MSNFKWSDIHNERILTDRSVVNVVMFVSRNKDNKDLPGFSERRTAFATTWSPDDPRLDKMFSSFAASGVNHETSRFYISVNDRDNQKIIAALQHYLIDERNNVNPAGLSLLTVRLAMKRENAATKRRLFDFDSSNEALLNGFVKDLKLRGLTDKEIEVYPTINHYSVVVSRGVDLRGLVDTIPDVPENDKKDRGPFKYPTDIVTYKVDDLLLVDWMKYKF